MKTIFSLINNFPILLSAVFTITFSCNVTAQSLPSATELLARASVKAHPRTIDMAALKSEIDYDGRWIIAQNRASCKTNFEIERNDIRYSDFGI